MSRADELVELLRGRIHSEFDGECHLTDTEAHAIADFLSKAEQRAPEGWKLVPVVSTGEMEDAARHLMMWLDFDRPTEAAVLAHCKRLGKGPPPECRDFDHVPPKAPRLFWVFRAMCSAAPALIPSDSHDAEGRE